MINYALQFFSGIPAMGMRPLPLVCHGHYDVSIDEVEQDGKS
jgi:hypothetical protein